MCIFRAPTGYCTSKFKPCDQGDLFMSNSKPCAKPVSSPPPPKVWNKRDPKTPVHAIYIGRGSKYGNPFSIGKHGDRNGVCDLYKDYLEANPGRKAMFIAELQGKDLVCWCSPQRCHGDYLLRIANE